MSAVKTALITGAAKRIGAALARDLHACGLDIVVHYHRSATEALALVAELNARRHQSAWSLEADLLDPDSHEKIIQKAVTCTGRLDVLINNASMFYPTPVGSTTLQQWNELMGTNLTAPFFLAQAAAPHLRATAGSIINITDIHGGRPLKDHPVYSTAKAGLIMLTRSLAKELGPEIRVNAVSPGAILWPETGLSDKKKEQILSRTVLKRLGTPEDITSAVRYLVQQAAYVTGQVLIVDGGRTFFTD
jgi:pteridine reductase